MRKILSLDGGGIKGIFALSFLANIESNIKSKIQDYFDLIVGTSTGGIIALALGLGFSSSEILKMYEDLGKNVFIGNKTLKLIRQFGISKYNQDILKSSLNEIYKDNKLGNSSKRLVIPSLNLETGEVHIYKTAHHERFINDYKVPMVDVCLATSAAPTYFPTQRSTPGTPLIDGGMWANNPMGIAAVEAISILNWQQGDIVMLSLGNTNEPLDINLGKKFGLGRFYWSFFASKVFMAGQSSGSLGIAKHLLGHKNVFRISPIVAPGKFKLDSINEISSLKGLGESEARKEFEALKNIFFNSTSELFEPYHKL